MVIGCNMNMTKKKKIGKNIPPSGSPGYEHYDFHHGLYKHLSLGVANTLINSKMSICSFAILRTIIKATQKQGIIIIYHYIQTFQVLVCSLSPPRPLEQLSSYWVDWYSLSAEVTLGGFVTGCPRSWSQIKVCLCFSSVINLFSFPIRPNKNSQMFKLLVR